MNENLFNAMFQQSAIAMSITRVDGINLYVNKSFAEMVGCNPEELINKTNKTITHPEDFAAEQLNIDKLRSGEITSFQIEKRYIHKLGHIVWGLLSVNYIYDDNGVPMYMNGQIQNITEKKLTEINLVNSEKKYRLIAENSFERISVLTRKGKYKYKYKYKYVSPAYELLGYRLEEINDINPFDLLHEDDRPLVKKTFETVVDDNSIITITYRIRDKEGNYFWTETSIKSMGNDNGFEEILLICRDITHRKKIEDRLKKVTKTRIDILESITDGFVAINNEDRFIYINSAALKILGKSRDKLLGSLCEDSIPELLSDELRYYYNIVKSKKTDVKFEIYSESLQASFAVRMYPTEGIVSIYLLNITEQKKMEEWMKKTEKLSLVGQLAAGFAHEIRNPMTSIKGFMQLAKTTQEFKSLYVDIILTELDRMEGIICEILSLAKPNKVVKVEKININDILKKVTCLLESQALLKNVSIHTNYNGSFSIECDGNQMMQVFINIIQNAIEASEQYTNIFVVIQEKDDEYILVSVEDEGCGITEERMEKLGEPFYSTKEKGTGLGLLVTYKIIKAHNGSINFLSQPGKGTTVEVILPKLAKNP